MAALRHSLADRLRRDGHADGKAVSNRFGEAEDVGHDVLPSEGERAAGPKPRLDLVTYKKDAAPVAAFADPFQVAVGGHSDTALPLDRLDDHGRDRVVEHAVEGVEVIEGDVASALEHRCEGIPILGVGRCRKGAKGASMVSPMRGNDADTPGRDAREFERGLDRLGTRVSKGDPAQRWGEQHAQRLQEIPARRRVEALVGIGQLRRLDPDGIGHQRMRVPKKIDAVVRHQVEIAAVLVVPQVRPLAPYECEPPAGMQGDRAELGVRGGQVVTHVPAPSKARVSGCSPRPSSSPTAWMPRRIACAAASSLTLARPLPYSATRSTSSRRIVGITLPSSLTSRMKPGVSAKMSRRSALSAVAISMARRSPSALMAIPSWLVARGGTNRREPGARRRGRRLGSDRSE